jgi:hypothetical protein
MREHQLPHLLPLPLRKRGARLLATSVHRDDEIHEPQVVFNPGLVAPVRRGHALVGDHQIEFWDDRDVLPKRYPGRVGALQLAAPPSRGIVEDPPQKPIAEASPALPLGVETRNDENQGACAHGWPLRVRLSPQPRAFSASRIAWCTRPFETSASPSSKPGVPASEVNMPPASRMSTATGAKSQLLPRGSIMASM